METIFPYISQSDNLWNVPKYELDRDGVSGLSNEDMGFTETLLIAFLEANHVILSIDTCQGCSVNCSVRQ